MYLSDIIKSVAVLEKDSELEELEALVKKQKENTKNYKENKMKYIPKSDIERMREDPFEATGKKPKKKWQSMKIGLLFFFLVAKIEYFHIE